MSFAYDRNRNAIFDPETGDTLRQERAHWQDPRWVHTIIGPDGRERFTAIILTDADGALANSRRKGDHVLTSAVWFGSKGVPREVGPGNPDLRRVLDYVRQRSDPSTRFHLSDRRPRRLYSPSSPVDYRFTLVLGLIGLVVAVALKLGNGPHL